MQIFYWEQLSDDDRLKLLDRAVIESSDSINKDVNRIINDIKTKGDEALILYTKEFDGISLNKIKVDKQKIDDSEYHIQDQLKNAIKIAYDNIYKFHYAQKTKSIDVKIDSGITCSLISRPINKVGLYIPGGSAPLLSTVLMLAIPAKIAKCREIILCSPPNIANEILYTAKICGIDTIYQIGGSQAIAAMSLGTNTVTKVDKIFGPGNAYVTEAKKQVNQFYGTAIDMQAGPSEVLVIADKTANPNFIAADLLAQAEHDAKSQVILLTDNEKIAQDTIKAIYDQTRKLSREKIINEALKYARIIVAENIKECINISNIYAPEHLIIEINNPRSVLDDIENAGSIFLGHYSPEPMGDYASGTNHVLPTYGLAKTVSSLSLADFSKRMTVQEFSQDGFIKLGKYVEILAAAELLDGHKNAVSIRLQELAK